MRAGRVDVRVETGTLWAIALQAMTPTAPIEAQAVAPGQRVFLDGLPQLVYAVTDEGNGRTRLDFGQGLYWEPRITLTSTALVSPAVPVPLTDAAAAWWVETTEEGAAERRAIPATIATDSLSVKLTLDADSTAALEPFAGAHSWDCYMRTTGWDWQRPVEGTFTILKGDAR